MKIAWLTDIHLNCIRFPESWWKEIQSAEYDAYVITGDITEAAHIDWTLSMFAEAGKPVYFVLGNHDFYGSSIEMVRRKLAGLPASPAGETVKYLNNEDVISLTEKSSLVGDDGWYDGRNGSYRHTDVELNDFYQIREFQGLSKFERLPVMHKYTDASARRISKLCKMAIDNPKMERLYIATHVPPFAGAAWHMGQPSEESHQPFFSNRIVGENIVEATKEFRQNGGRVTVLCGHSHSEGVMYPGMNLECRTGKAVYGHPDVYTVLQVD